MPLHIAIDGQRDGEPTTIGVRVVPDDGVRLILAVERIEGKRQKTVEVSIALEDLTFAINTLNANEEHEKPAESGKNGTEEAAALASA